MRLIGMRGLRSVLTTLGEDCKSMNVKEMRDRLYRWSEVVTQRTALEAIADSHGVLLLYIPKAHPWLSTVEKVFRWHKAQWKKHPSHSPTALKTTTDKMLDDGPTRQQAQGWWALVKSYAGYHASGKVEFISESAAKKLKVDRLRIPPSPVLEKPFTSLKSHFHSLNWRLKMGKKFSESTPLLKKKWPRSLKRKSSQLLLRDSESKRGRFNTNPSPLQVIEVEFPFEDGTPPRFFKGYVASVKNGRCTVHFFEDKEVCNFSWPDSKENPWRPVIEDNKEVYQQVNI